MRPRASSRRSASFAPSSPAPRGPGAPPARLPQHHLPDDLLLRHAAGHDDPAEALFVATHLTLCPRCRTQLEQLESIGGALLHDVQPCGIASGLLAATMARLDEPVPEPAHAPAPAGSDHGDGVLPRPLLQLVGPLESIRWQTRLLGLVKYLELPVERPGAVPMRMKRIRRGQRVPEHSHDARELELYLRGGALDPNTGKRYARGDVSIYDAGEPHRLQVDDDEDCILLCLDVRLIGTSLPSRLLYGLIGWG